jgi:hypothetical protein
MTLPRTHYNYFRDCDPAIERCVQSDPIRLSGGVKTYRYENANPFALLYTAGLAPDYPADVGRSMQQRSCAQNAFWRNYADMREANWTQSDKYFHRKHVTWDGKTVAPQIVAMVATPDGFRLDFTQPLGNGVSESILKTALSLESRVYRDAPDYGLPELDLHNEDAKALVVSADRKSLSITLASIEQKTVHPRQAPDR